MDAVNMREADVDTRVVLIIEPEEPRAVASLLAALLFNPPPAPVLVVREAPRDGPVDVDPLVPLDLAPRWDAPARQPTHDGRLCHQYAKQPRGADRICRGRPR